MEVWESELVVPQTALPQQSQYASQCFSSYSQQPGGIKAIPGAVLEAWTLACCCLLAQSDFRVSPFWLSSCIKNLCFLQWVTQVKLLADRCLYFVSAAVLSR